MAPGTPMNGTQILIWVVVIALILFRASRPQRISVARMWVMAFILMLLGAFAIYGYEMLNPAPPIEIVAAVVIGLLCGIPVGVLRGRHTVVSATDRHGVMQLGPSWVTAGIYLGAFAFRAVLRYFIPPTSPLGTVVGDAVLVFAIAIIGTTYYVVYRKYEALDHASIGAAS